MTISFYWNRIFSSLALALCSLDHTTCSTNNRSKCPHKQSWPHVPQWCTANSPSRLCNNNRPSTASLPWALVEAAAFTCSKVSPIVLAVVEDFLILAVAAVGRLLAGEWAVGKMKGEVGMEVRHFTWDPVKMEIEKESLMGYVVRKFR